MEAESTPRTAGLPAQQTTFVGRRTETASVRQLLRTSQLVTLLGPGGVGKTRLATQVASSQRRMFADGVRFVDLAGLQSPELLADELVASLALPTRPGQSQLDALTTGLERSDLLLVLDTCDRVVATGAQLLAQLLAHSQHVRILATSRAPFGLPGERVYVVEPFRVLYPTEHSDPGPDAAAAVQLFTERATAVVPDFHVSSSNRSTIESICARLDGLPLAIELAALHVPMFTVRDLLARVDDLIAVPAAISRNVPQRHAGLAATLDWSFELCTPEEQGLWTRCSVFRDGFDLAAAQRVCVDDSDSDRLLPSLSGLLSKSILLRRRSGGAVRFQLLDAVRAHGWKRLENRALPCDAHASWILDLARTGRDQWFGPGQREWLDRCDVERGNIRVAIQHSLSGPRPEIALETVAGLWFYWLSAGHLDEGRTWLDRALAQVETPSVERSRALWTAALFAILRHLPREADDLARQCLKEAVPLGDRAAVANAHHMLGLSAFIAGDLLLAESELRESVAAFEAAALADARFHMSRVHLAMTLTYAGRPDDALELLDQCRAACELADDRWVAAYVLQAQALAMFVLGDSAAGLRAALSGLAMSKHVRDARAITPRLDLLAWIAAAEGSPGRAATLLSAAESLWERERSPSYRSKYLTAMRERTLERVRNDLAPEAYATATARGAGLDLDQALAYALDERDTPRVPEPRRPVGLTARELEIAGHVSAGRSNKEIAQQLVLSPRTVENHVQRILTKLGFNSRTQIAVWALAEDDVPTAHE